MPASVFSQSVPLHSLVSYLHPRTIVEKKNQILLSVSFSGPSYINDPSALLILP